MDSVTDNVEKQAPELVPLVKAVRLTLKKHNLDSHTARVVLVLDISGSMDHLYRKRKVHDLVAQSMALGLNFDDDGEIDVFAFGGQCHYIGEYGLSTYKSCIDDILSRHPLEHTTAYEKPLQALIDKYGDSDLPVYVQFVTDGETNNPDRVEQVMRELSTLPIFCQFMGLGQNLRPDPVEESAPTAQAEPVKKGWLAKLFGGGSSEPQAAAKQSSARRASTDGFNFLIGLDNLTGRKVDNASFFAVEDPATVPSSEMYRLLMIEYPQWLKDARAAGILR